MRCGRRRGLPGPALALAGDLRADPGTDADDPLVRLALGAPTANEFLDVDASVVGLLEDAARQELDPGQRARVLARLAGQLLGDSSATARRRALIDEATMLAEQAGDDRVTAEVIDARLHAMWGADSLEERRALAGTVVACARRAGDTELELRGLFWRFVALMESARVNDAESALADYARAVSVAGNPADELVVVARHAMLAVLRGRLDEADAAHQHGRGDGNQPRIGRYRQPGRHAAGKRRENQGMD